MGVGASIQNETIVQILANANTGNDHDVYTPRGESAKKEVIRLRTLLANMMKQFSLNDFDKYQIPEEIMVELLAFVDDVSFVSFALTCKSNEVLYRLKLRQLYSMYIDKK